MYTYMMGGLTEEERFWIKVDATDPAGCWVWTGGRKEAGYGHFSVYRDGRWGKEIAHRYSYALLVGAIPDEWEIDHLCMNRACVNPAHLETVTVAENRRRRDSPEPFRLTRPVFPLPPKPVPPPKQSPQKRKDLQAAKRALRRATRAPAERCVNGHEYSVVGWITNGPSRRTCAGCRAVAYEKQKAKEQRGPRHGTETHCPQGHPYVDGNIYWRRRPDGEVCGRECRTCVAKRNRDADRRRVAAKRQTA